MNLTPELYQRIVAAKIYMDENYHAPLDLDIISRQAFLSRFHFHRMFRKVYQHTPHQYLTRIRLEKAKDLLSNNKPVNEVCNEVGNFERFAIVNKKYRWGYRAILFLFLFFHQLVFVGIGGCH